jgi:riboflavin synthase
MFTGIIEAIGRVTQVESHGSNLRIWVESPISNELKPDQSLCHNGVCLTIEESIGGVHRITAIDETLEKTNLAGLRPGDMVNLERCLKLSDRIDGHLVLGHVDTTAKCTTRTEKQGSWEFEFRFTKKFAEFIIEKGSICVNGVSLTAFEVTKRSFRIAIIPYTYEHTNFKDVIEGGLVNLEFDLIGKYVLRRLSLK